MSGGEEGESLEFTPTWVVAAVCSLIVAISLALERLLHRVGVVLKKKHQKPLYEALQKVKEELMLLGFISLLLTVFQTAVSKICVPESVVHSMLPCKREEEGQTGKSSGGTEHLQKSFSFSVASGVRRLLAEETVNQVGYCAKKLLMLSSLLLSTVLMSRWKQKRKDVVVGNSYMLRLIGTCILHATEPNLVGIKVYFIGKVPFLSLEAIHHLHIFIFILAIVHVIFCLLTVLLGGAKIRQWKHWEDSIFKDNYNPDEALKKKVTHVHQHAFIKDHFLGVGHNACLGWLHSFSKQFYASVTKADYETLRLGFVTTHCKTNPKFDFYSYMMRALEDDFKQVVGISWYLWVFVVIFLLLNISGWHSYFWIAFIPFGLLLAVGTKLEHVITQLAHEVAEKHVAIEGDLVVKPSDEHFWFKRPYIILFLIHFILFQNAFEIAFFFWIWIQFGFDSCIMGQIQFIVPRLVIGVIIQVLCSYSTLPLYAIVTQMGSTFKKAIFDEHVQGHLIGWANKARRKQAAKESAHEGQSSSQGGSSAFVQLGRVLRSPHGGREEDQQQPRGSDDSALP